MADIYLCRRDAAGGFRKRLVLKVPKLPALKQEHFVSLFLDEARLTASLHHPNIVHVYDIDVIDGIPHVAMEYIPGPHLGDIVRSATLEGEPVLYLAFITRIIADLCRGLAYAHGVTDERGKPLGIVHRDVSPTNILITRDGQAKLIDFGVATSTQRDEPTDDGTLKGKLRFIAPEQLDPNGVIDRRADIYSVGVCLYWATTHAFPFDHVDVRQLWAIRTANTFEAPSERRRDLPQVLEHIILKAMAPRPEDRYDNADQMADELEAFAQSQDVGHAQIAAWVQPHTSPPTEEIPRPIARRRSTTDLTIPDIERPTPPLPSSAPWLIIAILAVIVAGAVLAIRNDEVLADHSVLADPDPSGPLPHDLITAARTLYRDRMYGAAEQVLQRVEGQELTTEEAVATIELGEHIRQAKELVRAEQALDRGQLTLAQSILDDVLARAPEDTSALLLRARLLDLMDPTVKTAAPASQLLPVELQVLDGRVLLKLTTNGALNTPFPAVVDEPRGRSFVVRLPNTSPPTGVRHQPIESPVATDIYVLVDGVDTLVRVTGLRDSSPLPTWTISESGIEAVLQ